MLTPDHSFLLSKSFQMNETFTANDQRTELICTLSSALKYNRDYVIVIPKNIRFSNGYVTNEPMSIRFSTQFAPLYASLIEVADALRGLQTLFEPAWLMKEIRNASKHVHQLLKIQTDPNQSDYAPLTEDNALYYPASQFVIATSVYRLLIGLLSQIIQNNGTVPGNAGFDSFTLGDFSLSEGSATQQTDQIKSMIQLQIKAFKEQSEEWKAILLGRSNKGYASPQSGTTRKTTIGPESRDLT